MTVVQFTGARALALVVAGCCILRLAVSTQLL
jgi:hypothetical protein